MADVFGTKMKEAIAIKEAIEKNESNAASVFGLAFGYLLGAAVVFIFTHFKLPFPIAGPGIGVALFISMAASLFGHYRETKRLKEELRHLVEEMHSPPTM